MKTKTNHGFDDHTVDDLVHEALSASNVATCYEIEKKMKRPHSQVVWSLRRLVLAGRAKIVDRKGVSNLGRACQRFAIKNGDEQSNVELISELNIHIDRLSNKVEALVALQSQKMTELRDELKSDVVRLEREIKALRSQQRSTAEL